MSWSKKRVVDYRNDKTIELVTTRCSVDVKTSFFLQELAWADSAREMRIAAIYSPVLCHLSSQPFSGTYLFSTSLKSQISANYSIFHAYFMNLHFLIKLHLFSWTFIIHVLMAFYVCARWFRFLPESNHSEWFKYLFAKVEKFESSLIHWFQEHWVQSSWEKWSPQMGKYPFFNMTNIYKCLQRSLYSNPAVSKKLLP